MSEEEKEAMDEDEIKFRAYLLFLNSDFPTHRKKEAMEELLKIYNKQQKTIQEQNNFIEKLVKEHKEEVEKLKKNRDVQRELINDAVFDGYEKNYKSQLEDFTKEIDRLKNIIKSFESGEMVIGVKK